MKHKTQKILTYFFVELPNIAKSAFSALLSKREGITLLNLGVCQKKPFCQFVKWDYDRLLKLSSVGSRQYLEGWPPSKKVGCSSPASGRLLLFFLFFSSSFFMKIAVMKKNCEQKKLYWYPFVFWKLSFFKWVNWQLKIVIFLLVVFKINYVILQKELGF